MAHLDADLIVYATGYNSMNGWVADLMGQDTADKLGKCWGLGSDTTKDPAPWEGEQRNMWKPTQVPNLWMHGGNLHQSRHYSQFLSLQIKARIEEFPLRFMEGKRYITSVNKRLWQQKPTFGVSGRRSALSR